MDAERFVDDLRAVFQADLAARCPAEGHFCVFDEPPTAEALSGALAEAVFAGPVRPARSPIRPRPTPSSTVSGRVPPASSAMSRIAAASCPGRWAAAPMGAAWPGRPTCMVL